MNNREVLIAGGSLLLGSLLGYILTKRSVESRYETIIQEEIDDVKQHYKKINERVSIEDEQSVESKDKDREEDFRRKNPWGNIEDYEKILGDLTYGSISIEDEYHLYDILGEDKDEIPPIVKDDGDPDMDPLWRDMVSKRSEDKPYIISADEYMMEKEEYDKLTLAYFQGDDVLCDDQDTPLDEAKDVVGSEALSNFGLYSKDENIVYVRNDRLMSDFEIMKDERKFSVVILGSEES